MLGFRVVVLLTALVLSVGCAEVTREQAIAAAKDELVRRRCSLPKKYTVNVEEGVYKAEMIEPPRPLWEVDFYAPRARAPLYTVLINRRTGAVDDFMDSRREIPSRIFP